MLTYRKLISNPRMSILSISKLPSSPMYLQTCLLTTHISLSISRFILINFSLLRNQMKSSRCKFNTPSLSLKKLRKSNSTFPLTTPIIIRQATASSKPISRVTTLHKPQLSVSSNLRTASGILLY